METITISHRIAPGLPDTSAAFTRDEMLALIACLKESDDPILTIKHGIEFINETDALLNAD